MKTCKSSTRILACGLALGSFSWSQARADLILPYEGVTDAGVAFKVVSNTPLAQSQAICGQNNSHEIGAFGVFGYTTEPQNFNAGVLGLSLSVNGFGVIGRAQTETGNNTGVYGISDSVAGTGVAGYSPANVGVCGLQGTEVTDYFSPFGPIGVYGVTNSSNGSGVRGLARSMTGVNFGVFGQTNSKRGYAGYFRGHVHVAGTLSKAAGSFKIDHPLDPANKYLSHSFVESPDMMNIYNGVVVLDAKGQARVTMPDWFEALNRDFRYQLTAIGAPGPNLHVAQEIADRAFTIAGGKPGLKVSWQVTGIRQDAWANAHRIPVEEEKAADERGTFLHPEVLGQPESLRIENALQPEPPARSATESPADAFRVPN